MSPIIAAHDLRMSGPFTIQKIRRFSMEAPLGDHARASLSGLVYEEIGDSEVESPLRGQTVSIFTGDDPQPLFSGLIQDAILTQANEAYNLELQLISGTYLLDTRKKSRSFQDIQMTYTDVVNQTLEDTPGAAKH